MTTSSTQQRLALGAVWLLAGGVVGLGSAQIFDLIDRLDLVIAAYGLLMGFVALGTVLGWLPWRRK
jgi:hypothetical protein